MKEKSTLQFILQEGEGFRVEFKQKLANLDREIVAFANACGGSIYLGVNDDGSIKGIDISNRLKSQVTDIARNCDPSIHIELVAHKALSILELKVTEGIDKPYRCKDGFFLRIGPSSQKLKRDEILQLINESGKLPFDEITNPRFDLKKHFSMSYFDDYLQKSNISVKLPLKEMLINLGCAEEKENGFLLNNGGILFFAENPQFFFPEAYITAVKYRTFDRFSIIDKQDAKGTIIQQIEQVIQFILRHIAVETKIMPTSFDLQRQEIYDYPLVALREAIINAVTHRDYQYDGSHIYIHMYPDRIEIESPGGLYRGLTLENLGKRSVRRNRLIAELLHRAKYIERVGSGFDRMKRALEDNNNPPLEVAATNFFNICFYKRIIAPNVAALTPRQLTLYRLLEQRKKVTKQEAAMALSVSSDTALRELKVLVKAKLIAIQGAGKTTVYVYTTPTS